nr:diguanylate cyclase [Aromatoleum toluvorans]
MLLLAWILFSVSLFVLVLRGTWENIRSEFQADAEADIELLRDRLRTNEALLAGFAAFLGAVESPTDAQLADFAERLLADNPHIYSLEVVDKVSAAERSAFERKLAARLGEPVRIGRFDFDDGGRRLPVADKPVYYPIAFMWPDTPRARRVLGLDVDSVPYVRDALQRARRSGAAVSSPPFALTEGALAYVMLRRATGSPPDDAVRAAAAPERLAQLIVKAGSLRPGRSDPRTAHTLYAIGEAGPLQPPLFDMPAVLPTSPHERRLLPQISMDLEDYSASPPIRLSVSRQMRFVDVPVEPLALAAFLACGSLAVLVWHLRRHRAAVAREHENHERASHSALHDPLTGLPNRRLLQDRVGEAAAHWRRSGEGFALFFVDLDRFKEVNDRHGHDAGDVVLSTVAAHMRGSVRETDTVARIAGDEFVVLLPGVMEHAAAVPIAAKLLAAVAQPVELRDGLVLRLTASLGVSVCPGDGDDPEELIRRADAAMYDDKRAGDTGSHGTLLEVRAVARAPRLRVIRKLVRVPGGAVVPGGRKKVARGRS